MSGYPMGELLRDEANRAIGRFIDELFERVLDSLYEYRLRHAPPHVPAHALRVTQGFLDELRRRAMQAVGAAADPIGWADRKP